MPFTSEKEVTRNIGFSPRTFAEIIICLSALISI